MLVLRRRPQESIMIRCPDGTVIELKVLNSDGGGCRIGVDAPNEYVILRKEVEHDISRI